MPELPDVEHMLQGFRDSVPGQQVRSARVLEPEYVDVEDASLREKVEGHQIEQVERRGKYALLSLDSGFTLIYHMGMTGWLELRSSEQVSRKEGLRKHDQLILELAGGQALCYGCVRKIGSVHLVEGEDFSSLPTLNSMGVEPLSEDFTWNVFARLLEEHSRSMIKSLLMDQASIAGIGNEYSDEILYHARVHPRVKVGDLREDQRRTLYQEIRGVLIRAVQYYEEIHSEGAPWLIVRREEGTLCPRCESEIRRVKVSGRSAYFCPQCQPRG